MSSGFEWSLLIVLSTAMVLVTLLITVWFEGRRLADVRSVSVLGESLGMRYRVLGRDHLLRPEPFVLHERPGVVAERSVIERSLVHTRASGLPAIFEYVTYRDPIGLRRSGPPFLVLAARVPAGVRPFRLRPRTLLERFPGVRRGEVAARYNVPTGWTLRIDDAVGAELGAAAVGSECFARSGLWIQVSGRAVFIAQPMRCWQFSGLAPRAIKMLIRRALPVLKALDSPDVPILETVMVPYVALVPAPAPAVRQPARPIPPAAG